MVFVRSANKLQRCTRRGRGRRAAPISYMGGSLIAKDFGGLNIAYQSSLFMWHAIFGYLNAKDFGGLKALSLHPHLPPRALPPLAWRPAACHGQGACLRPGPWLRTCLRQQASRAEDLRA